MFKYLIRRLFGRDIRGVTKRLNRMRNDIADNIKTNDDTIARTGEIITKLKTAQDMLQAENATGAKLAESLKII